MAANLSIVDNFQFRVSVAQNTNLLFVLSLRQPSPRISGIAFQAMAFFTPFRGPPEYSWGYYLELLVLGASGIIRIITPFSTACAMEVTF